MVFETVREISTKATGHERRGWQFTAAQFDDCLRRWQCGREPAYAHEFAGHPCRCWRRNADARPLCSACLQADDQSVPEPLRETRSDERGAVWRFNRQIGKRLSKVRRAFL